MIAKTNSSPGNEVFDLSDPATAQLYEELKVSVKPEAIRRDTTSWDEITEGVRGAIARYEGNGIVLLSGAYPHIIGSLVTLARLGEFNMDYVPLDGTQISTRTEDYNISAGRTETLSLKTLRVQMQRSLGVAKQLGFADMEKTRAFLDNQSRRDERPTLTVIVQNETGLHHLYTKSPFKEAHDQFIERLTTDIRASTQKPAFVFYSSEDASLEGYAMMMRDGRVHTATQKFLLDMKQEGIAVEIGAFGHRDRYGYEIVIQRFEREL